MSAEQSIQRIEKDLTLIQEAALMIHEGKTIREALVFAGYPEAQARKGSVAIPQVMRKLIAQYAMAEGKTYAEIGRGLDPVTAENMIAGKLMSNMIAGESKGNDAAALLGKMRRYNAFEKDSFAGVVVLTPGNAVAGKKLELPDTDDVIDGEVLVVVQSETTPLDPVIGIK